MRAIVAARRITRRTASVAVLALIALVLAACGSTRTNDNPTSDAALPGLMPGEVVTVQGRESAALYLPIFIVAVLIFILVEGLVLYSAWRFRRRSTDTALPAQTHGHGLLEVLWTAIPFGVVLIMFVGSALIVLPKVTAVEPNPAVTVDATAAQFYWTFEYRDHGLRYSGRGKNGPEMVVPVDERVTIRLHAVDVIHAFYVPAFFYKKDAVPGRDNEFQVVIEQPGTYGGQCAEFCGLSHGDMYFTVRAVERPEYDAWLDAEIERANATPTPRPTPPPGASQTPPPVGELVKVRTTPDAPVSFDATTIPAKAGSTITVEYTNDTPLEHNIVFFAGPDETAPIIAQTEVRTGPGDVQSVTFEVPAAPGSYFYWCEVHPTSMKGTLEVTS